MKEICIQYFKTPVAEMILGSYEDQLCMSNWRYRKKREANDQRICKGLQASFVEQSSEVIEAAKEQIHAYFAGERTVFDIPLRLVGTPFQERVWKMLLTIPFGQTETYLGLSKRLHHEKAIRAVAAANGANALSLFVPCHRVIGSNGDMVGYAGGISTKKRLLKLEGSWGNSEQLELFT